MYEFELTEKFLTEEEKEVFNDYLKVLGLDYSIWAVFKSLFESGTKHTRPYLLKCYNRSGLQGAAIILRCTAYGRALFNNKIAAEFINIMKIPAFIWIKFGCCMDMMSNQGFVREPDRADEVISGMINYLGKNTLLTLVTDYTYNSGLYENAALLPALPHALIDTSSFSSLNDYLSNHKNLRHKMNVFRNKGGNCIIIENKLNDKQIDAVKKCFLSTSEKSVFYLPYQDLYLKAALHTSASDIKDVLYFIALLNGEIIGYQAAVKSGLRLNALHGAFNRDLKTNHHAYEILFVKMTEFAVENELKSIDFGAVLNYTKQKMVNKTTDMSYFVLSRYSTVTKAFSSFLKATKVQGDEQLKFRNR